MTRELVRGVCDEEIAKVRRGRGAAAPDGLDRARGLFEEVALGERFVEFLTIPGYERLDGA